MDKIKCMFEECIIRDQMDWVCYCKKGHKIHSDWGCQRNDPFETANKNCKDFKPKRRIFYEKLKISFIGKDFV